MHLMSVQAGIWHFDGGPPDRVLVEKISRTAAQCGPDSEHVYADISVRMLFRSFHTTKESRLARQPYLSPNGNVITWDGRLDNREEMLAQFTDTLSCMSPDVSVVAAAFDRWGLDCLPSLIGDWALSVWNPKERKITLAVDYMGTRHLYYSLTENRLIW